MLLKNTIATGSCHFCYPAPRIQTILHRESRPWLATVIIREDGTIEPTDRVVDVKPPQY